MGDYYGIEEDWREAGARRRGNDEIRRRRRQTNRQTNKQEGRGAVVCVYFSQHATGAVSHAVEEGKVAGA